MGGIAAPEIVGEQRLELGRHEPHLGGELHALLPHVLEPLGRFFPEEDHRLRTYRAILGDAKRQEIDACITGDGLERHVQRGSGIGDPGAVHMQQQSPAVGELAQRLELLGRVDGTVLGALGDRDHPRLCMMLEADALDVGFDQRRGQLAIGGFDRQELASDVPLGCAALIHLDVRCGCGDDAVLRKQHGIECGDVGAGAAEDEERLRRFTQGAPQQQAGALGVLVVAVGGCVSGVDPGHRGQHVRVGAGGIVARERTGMAHSSSGTLSSQSAMTLPSGSVIIAMTPHDCLVGSVMNRTPFSCSSPQKWTRPGT